MRLALLPRLRDEENMLGMISDVRAVAQGYPKDDIANNALRLATTPFVAVPSERSFSRLPLPSLPHACFGSRRLEAAEECCTMKVSKDDRERLKIKEKC